MKLQLLASAAVAILSVPPYVKSASVEPASALGGIFEKQVLEGKDRAAAPDVLVDALARHPHLYESIQKIQCQDRGRALGQCLREGGGGDDEVQTCADCFAAAFSSDTIARCEDAEEQGLCTTLEACMTSSCNSTCSSQFINGANCVLDANRCGSQCAVAAGRGDGRSSFAGKASKNAASANHRYRRPSGINPAANVAAIGALFGTIAATGLGLVNVV
eukprot:CAMPEP_0172535274 /NCGR_PEP_ID=MMETSP1067-20121228/7361_1 /TAXON_ID=265564 ORGANISM="Thalassiosira punctigera, Strain Tpunct2005C2" /NCGR_SAMPLE_ID=MMETSP1067 /ASSEMBLY_ACC=CAM_ASM_000444 /LENGTH=217 /DNA_ID=CAMNT_0013320197 /DNA_START=79 /DNA_END=732 /DNA_ORIENTATION=+